MRGLFFSVGLHAAGIAALWTLPVLMRGDPPLIEPPLPPLMQPTLIRVAQPTILPPRRGGARAGGGGGGLRPPTSNDVAPRPPTTITEEELQPEGFGDPNLPPGPVEVGRDVEPGPGGGSGAQTVEPAVVRADVDVRPPRKVSGANPVYPPLAIAARVEGIVILECTIGTDGRVVDLHVLRGHPLFDAAAVQAVSTWNYVPTLLNGRPVSVLMTVTVKFQLR